MATNGHGVCYVCSASPGLPREEQSAGIRVLRMGTGISLLARSFVFYLRHRHEFELVYEDVIGGSRLPFLAPLYVRQPLIAAWHQVNRSLLDGTAPKLMTSVVGASERPLASLYRRAYVRVPSEERKQELHRELGFRLDQLYVIPASLPNEWLAGVTRNGSKPSSILFIGNIRKYKGIHFLIQALPLIFKSCPNTQAVVAGRRWDLEYEDTLRALVSSLGLADRVTFRFNISEDEKKVLLQQALVLVLPSTLEGFGIVVLEANASGVPVVASSGVPEDAVEHRFNGLRVPYGDIDALAGAVIELLNDDRLYRQLSENCLRFAQRFSLDRVGAQFETLALAAAGRS